MGPQDVHEGRPFGLVHLNDHAQLFIEQRFQGPLGSLNGHLLRTNLEVTPIRSHWVNGQQVDVDGQATARGKGHLGQTSDQATIRSIVIGLHQLLLTCLQQGLAQALNLLRVF